MDAITAAVNIPVRIISLSFGKESALKAIVVSHSKQHEQY
jgi:hypothetical protein